MEHRKQPVSPEVALASDVFDKLCSANTLKTILGFHRHLCELLHLKPGPFPQFYLKLKSKLRSWKAQPLWNKFDKRASHKCYNRGKACPNTRVLIIGAGPCGLRAAIEAQLLGCKVVVIEKRDRISRNNVLHLWPFVIQDLRALGAKKFFGKFCAGAIDHISIRQLQCILLKVALILGVEFHEGVGFEAIVPPPEDQTERIGWRCVTSPPDHPVSQYEFDVLIGADGKRNTLEGFRRKEFRGKLAIAITANFINRRSEAEARVEEISGVAFIFNQKFFKDLYAATGIDLENIVYYKDETHYFVMTAKKHSLLNKNVILQDYPDTAKLLDPENVDKEALMEYAREAADFSTNYKLPHTEFAVNHYGQPDVAMFDFTSMYAAENASRVVERRGHKLLTLLVGDSLLEPFWPTGSGCARGFLSVLDGCWAIKAWGSGQYSALEVLAERESIYRLLGQTTPENLNRDLNAYTLEPQTRYPNFNSRAVLPIQVRGLFDTDDPSGLEAMLLNPSAASALEMPKKRRRKDSQVHPDTLLHWLKKQVALYDNIHISDMTSSFKNGLALCAIIHRYRPDLIDFHSLKPDDIVENNQLAFDTLERELGIPPVMTAQEMEECEVPDKLAMLSYLSQIYDTFRGEIPHIKHPKLDDEDIVKDKKEKTSEALLATRMRELSKLTPQQKVSLLGRITNHRPSSGRKKYASDRELGSDRGDRDGTASSIISNPERRHANDVSRRNRKRRSGASDRSALTLEEQIALRCPPPDLKGLSLEEQMSRLQERIKRLEEIKQNRIERQQRSKYMQMLTRQQFYKSIQMLQANAPRSDDDDTPFDDYSLFMYRMTAPDFQDRVKSLEQKLLYPDRDRLQEEMKRGTVDPEFSGRIKHIEDKLRRVPATEKKPRDLNRAIGKIEKTDWNVKEIEKKIAENKTTGRSPRQRAEKVPKWSRQQFDDKFSAMERKLRVKGFDEETASKYAEIDMSLKQLEKKIKEGGSLEAGKVSAMAAQLAHKNQQEAEKTNIQRSNSRPALVLPAQGGSEMCHFCNKRVYLMERLSAEGRFFHRGCFRCEYCSTTLRLGSYAFDRDGKFGSRFFCTHHFGMHGTQKMKTARKSEELRNILGKENIPRQLTIAKPPDKSKYAASSVDTADSQDQKTPSTPQPQPLDIDLDLDRGQTPERITFSNLAGAAGSSDQEDHPSEMDEDEWTDRNFGASAAECDSSDDLSDLSDEDDDGAEAFAEAIDVPLTADETLRLAENWTRRYSTDGARQNGAGDKDRSALEPNADEDDEPESGSYEYEDESDDFSYQEYDSEDDDSDTATEGEEEIRQRELRKQEVRLEVPDCLPGRNDTDTGSDTEVASEETSSESESVENSATEIETDSEFEHDGTTPTRHEIPDIIISDHLTQDLEEPKKVQIRSGNVVNGNITKESAGIKLQFSPLQNKVESNNNAVVNEVVNQPTPVRPSPLINPRRGDYLLNRTQSTGGIASKLSLELKKRYLLGGDSAGSVKKSGSATTLDSRFKSFVDQISEHQKLLNPAPEPSPTMQAFLQSSTKLHTSPKPSLPSSATSSITASTVATYGKKELPPVPGVFPHVCRQSSLEKSLSLKLDKSIPDVAAVSLPGHKELPSDNVFEHVCGKGTSQPLRVENCRTSIPKDEPEEPLDSLQPDSLIIQGSDEEKNNIHEASDKQTDSRPRSPAHETSIIVPSIAWQDVKGQKGDMDSDSLSSDVSLVDEVEEEEERNDKAKQESQQLPPRVEVHNSCGELLQDVSQRQVTVHPVKPALDLPLSSISLSSLGKHIGPGSGRSSPVSPVSIQTDIGQAPLTETELSDWAHDANPGVSEDLDDVEFNINPEFVTLRRNKKHKNSKKPVRAENVRPAKIATGEDLEDFESDNARSPAHAPAPVPRLHALASEENLEFMDTGEEGSSTDDQNNPIKENLRYKGYAQFVNSDETSPCAINKELLRLPDGNGYVQLKDNEEDEDAATPVVDSNATIPPIASMSSPENTTSSSSDSKSILDQNKGTSSTVELFDEDNSYHVEPSTEDATTTTSDMVTIVDTPLDPPPPALVKGADEGDQKAYAECVKRLQGRVSPFSNAKDSIDIRKSRRSNKSSPELVSPIEEKSAAELQLDMTPTPQEPNNSPTNNAGSGSLKSPTTSRKLQQLSQERSKQKSLIHDMVMDKLLAQKKSPQERKARKGLRNSLSPLSGSSSIGCIPNLGKLETESSKAVAPPALSNTANTYADAKNEDPSRCHSDNDILDKVDEKEKFYTPMLSVKKRTLSTPDDREEYLTPLTSMKKRAMSETRARPFSVHGVDQLHEVAEKTSAALPDTPLTNPEAFSLPDIRKALFSSPDDVFKTPVAPPRAKHEEAKRTADRERARREARARARLKSDEELGLSPEDYIKALKEKASRRLDSSVERVQGTPVLDGSADAGSSKLKVSGGDGVTLRPRPKSKDSERRKSIIQAVSDFFHKKSSSSGSPSSPSPPSTSQNTPDRDRERDREHIKFPRFRLAHKSKEKEKDKIKQVQECSASGKDSSLGSGGFMTAAAASSANTAMAPVLGPPPVPPPPSSYLPRASGTKWHVDACVDDSQSELEDLDDSRATGMSTPTHGSLSLDGSSSKKQTRLSRRVSRQAQLKRLRMAQEIQRQLEELEVKQKELEQQGVSVEKALRGEGNESGREEVDLLHEWFTLMRERSELRRYERELIVRAQELELEDRHARLQLELRDRLSKDDASKTGDDVATEGRILSEMLEIVQKRDSLIARLEADRQRCGWLANMPQVRRHRPQKTQRFLVLLLWLAQLAVAWALSYVVVGLLLPDPES
ncbi:F-actin-monooxygenase Mical isoform X4 [Thrips palmi]|uniref:F-actin monooxygenase n=1 Tax=Thrips palmi TaxID=161013 RepID=A0A6P8YA26_THRPL|nr:F-actin-monooxygenase Mical isoform X4 [Thrips palmi]